jgi:hypothetical protein
MYSGLQKTKVIRESCSFSNLYLFHAFSLGPLVENALALPKNCQNDMGRERMPIFLREVSLCICLCMGECLRLSASKD